MMDVTGAGAYDRVRRFPRYSYHSVSLFEENRPRGRNGLGEVIMVGRGGAGIISSTRVEVGAVIKFEMAIRAEVFRCSAEVVYANPTGDERFHIGLKFHDIDDGSLEQLNILLKRNETKQKARFTCADHPELEPYLH